MTEERDSLDPELAALFAEETAAGGHPDVDTLAAHLAGELDPAAAEEVEEHLARCRACADVVLDLDALAPESPSEGTADFELAAAWRSFRERRGEEGTPADAGLPWLSRRLLATAAAIFFAATLGLSLQVTTLRREAARRDLPQADVPVVYLDSTRAEETAAPLRLDAGDERFVVFLTPAGTADLADWEVTIEDAQGTVLWRGEGLTLNEFGSLRLGLSRRFLGPGEVVVRLFGRDGGEQVEVGAYRLDLR